MKIHYVHEGKSSVANLHYNFKELKDCVHIHFRNGFNEDISFSKIDDEWHSVSDLQTRNATTYFNIQEAIVKHFKGSIVLGDFLLQSHLS